MIDDERKNIEIGFGDEQLIKSFSLAFKFVNYYYDNDLPQSSKVISQFNEWAWSNAYEKNFVSWRSKVDKVESLSREELTKTASVVIGGNLIPINEYHGVRSISSWPITTITGMPGTGKTTIGRSVTEELNTHNFNMRLYEETPPWHDKDKWRSVEWMYKAHSIELMFKEMLNLRPQEFFPTAHKGPQLYDRGVMNQIAFAYANTVIGLNQDPPANKLLEFTEKTSAILSANINSLIVFQGTAENSIDRRGVGRLLTEEYYHALEEGYSKLPEIIAKYRGGISLTKDTPLLLFQIDTSQPIDVYSETVKKALGTTFKFYTD